MKTTLPQALAFVGISTLCLLPLHAQPADRVWIGSDGANWNNANHWDPADVPNSNAERAVINGSLGGGATVIYNLGTTTLGGLDIASGFTLARSAADTGNRTITLNAATATATTFNNAGSIISGGTSGLFTLNIHQDSSTIANSGLIEASTGTELRLQSNSNNPILVTNTGGVIRTAGNSVLHLGTATTNPVSLTGGTLQNAAGTINQSRLTDLTNVTVTNGGFYNVDTGGNAGNPWGLRLNGTASFTNSGTLNMVRQFVNDASSQGQSNTLNINSADAVFSNSGTVNIIASGDPFSGGGAASFTFTVSSEVVNDGVIHLDSRSTTNRSMINIASNQTATLSGDGEILMSVGPGGSVDQVVITGGLETTLVNAADHTIRGAGQLGNNTVNVITNAGTIHADSADHALTINPRTTIGFLTNSGTLRASGVGGMIIVNGTTTNTGLVRIDSGSSLAIQDGVFSSSAGTLLVDGSFSSIPDIAMSGGALEGAGSITGDINVSGVVQIAPQTLASNSLLLTGDLTFDSNASLLTHSLVFDQPTSFLTIDGNLSVGANNAFEFTFQPGGYEANVVYTLLDITGTNNINPATFSLSSSSIASGYVLDFDFGSNNGWNLSGSDLEVRFSAVPEPSAALFVLLGLALILARHSRRSRPGSQSLG